MNLYSVFLQITFDTEADVAVHPDKRAAMRGKRVHEASVVAHTFEDVLDHIPNIIDEVEDSMANGIQLFGYEIETIQLKKRDLIMVPS